MGRHLGLVVVLLLVLAGQWAAAPGWHLPHGPVAAAVDAGLLRTLAPRSVGHPAGPPAQLPRRAGRVAGWVPAYHQWDGGHPITGCGPAAGAMLLAFWAGQGYPGFQDAADRPGGRGLMAALYREMGTGAAGTLPGGWAAGLARYANRRAPWAAFAVTTAYSDRLSPDRWRTFTGEVAAGRPAAVFLGRNGKKYSYHFVVAHGYLELAGGGRFLFINNSWGESDVIDYDEYRQAGRLAFLFVRPATLAPADQWPLLRRAGPAGPGRGQAGVLG